LEQKQGILITEGKPEASLAFELLETETDNWLTSGWSLDAVTTPTRGGLGIAKDIKEKVSRWTWVPTSRRTTRTCSRESLIRPSG